MYIIVVVVATNFGFKNFTNIKVLHEILSGISDAVESRSLDKIGGLTSLSLIGPGPT